MFHCRIGFPVLGTRVCLLIADILVVVRRRMEGNFAVIDTHLRYFGSQSTRRRGCIAMA